MRKPLALLLAIFAVVSLAPAQSILPPYLQGEWKLVDNPATPPGHELVQMTPDTRVSPTAKMQEDGVHFYFYADNSYQKSIYTAADRELLLGNGKVLSFQDGELILSLEEMHINGKPFAFAKVMPELQFDTLHIAQAPPFHFKDMLEYPSSKRGGQIVRDSLVFLKVGGFLEESGE